MSAWTYRRLAAVHASPMLRILAIIVPSIAASRSASSKTMNGALPPSSIDVRSTWSAACLSSTWPTCVEPVNDSLRRRGSPMIGAENAPESEVGITESTPSGRPASASRRPRASIDSGVSAAGLTIAVHPAANAGPSLRVPIARGKFHGVIR